jgi:hypothetical protein
MVFYMYIIRSLKFYIVDSIMALDYVAKTLHPIRVAVWGEEAMGFLGVPTILSVSVLYV